MVTSMYNPYGWNLAEKKGRYYMWSRKDSTGLLWNCTIHPRPPSTGSGYARREALEQLRGII